MKEVPGSQSRPQPAPSFEELLSAYHDGELSPPEREAIEHRLAASPEARQQLLELRRLSGLLHELPQAKLPQEFSRQVLREAEREMLIPRLRGTTPVARRRSWLWITAGVAASAAAMVAVTLTLRLDHTPKAGQVSKSTGGHDVAMTPVKPIEEIGGRHELETMPSRSSGQPGAMTALREEHRAGPNLDAAAADDGHLVAKKEIGAGDAKFAATSPAQPVEDGFRSHESASVSGKKDRDPAERKRKKDSAAWKIVDAARRAPGGQAAVVRMVVVDQAAAIKVVQVVLDQDPMAPDGSVGSVAGVLPQNRDQSKSAVGGEQQIDGLQCVLVEMSNDQLVAVVRKLLKEDPAIRSLEVEDPIALAELPQTPNAELFTTSASAAEPAQMNAIVPPGLTAEKASPPSSLAPRMMARAAPSLSKSLNSAPSLPDVSKGKDSIPSADKPQDPKAKVENRSSINQPSASLPSIELNAPPKIVAKNSNGKLPQAPRAGGSRAWVGQVPRQTLKPKAGSAKLTYNRRLPPATLDSEDLSQTSKSRLNDRKQEQDKSPSSLAKIPPEAALPANALPMRVLFVLEPQSPVVPIDGPPAKAKVPGKTGGARGTNSRFSRQG